jgi:iron complex transport system substrate-binding protein
MLKRTALTLAAIAVATTACGSSSDTTTTTVPSDAGTSMFVGIDGVQSDISDTSRIVVLNGDLTEIIFALGAGDRVVGVDLTTTYPDEAVGLPSVGLGRRLVAEEVIALEPTLVIGDTQIEPQSSIDQIRNADIPVVILDLQVTLTGAIRKIETVAGILGLESEGTALAETVQAEIDDALDLASGATTSPRVGYLYVRGPETLLMFGNGMPTHFLIEAAGGIDAFGETGVTFAKPLDAESLVTAAPDVLLTPAEGFAIIGGLPSFLALPGVGDTPAAASNRILTYDEAMLLGMGPRVGQALRQLILDLHPELSTP